MTSAAPPPPDGAAGARPGRVSDAAAPGGASIRRKAPRPAGPTAPHGSQTILRDRDLVPRLPRGSVVAVTALCLLPTLLALVGLPLGQRAADGAIVPAAARVAHATLEGVVLACGLGLLALGALHHVVTRRRFHLGLAVALAGAAAIESIHAVLSEQAWNQVPMAPEQVTWTWLVSRILSAILLLVAGEAFLRERRVDPLRHVGAVVCATLIVAAAASAAARFADPESLRRVLTSSGLVSSPLDLVPLALFAAGAALYRPLSMRVRGAFAQAVLLSFVPHVVAQVHALFAGLGALDHHAQSAHLLQALAFALPLAGLALDHVRAGGVRMRSEDHFEAFAATAADPMVIMDETGRMRAVNDAVIEVFGHAREQLIGHPMTMLMPPFLRDGFLSSLQRYVDTGKRHMSWKGVELPGLHATGRIIPLEISLGEVRRDGKLLFFGIARDVSRRKDAERALRDSEERYALALRAANDGLWDWDLKTDAVYFSARWKGMLGLDVQAVSGKPEEWFGRVHPADVQRLKADIQSHLHGQTPHFQNEHRILHADGTYRWMLARGVAVTDTRGLPSRMAGSLSDVTERKEAEERLVHEVLHDALTGLPNRSFFLDRLRQALNRSRRRPGQVFAVIFVDLDRFKVVNDSLGHGHGDQLLVMFSRRLEASLRPGDSAARLGGDEFAVLLENVAGRDEAEAVASRIQEALRESFKIAEHDVFTSASIGIALSSPRYKAPEEVLRDADTAMYRAKKLGKARHEVFEAGMHAQAVTLLQLETDLRRAVDRKEFTLRYQPIVSLETGRLCGLEALVRWQHPTRGLLAPDAFLAVAEESGLILPIGSWVFEESCRQLQAWRRKLRSHLPLYVSVNLSTRQFSQHDLVPQLRAALEASGLDGTSLMLEITESMLMADPEDARRILATLRGLKIRMVLDDFGTGYSSLSHLHEFPIDMFKIDRSFVSRMGEDGSNSELVRTIVHLARNLSMSVVAEGVETPGQLARLRALKCDWAQGFLFSPPIDADAAAMMIQQNPRW